MVHKSIKLKYLSSEYLQKTLQVIINEIRQFFSGKRVYLAVSGGPDSMFMATFFHNVLPKEQLTILHFDHRVRKNSDNDVSIIKKSFSSTRILTGKADKPGSTETDFREQRLAFFSKETPSGAYIVTGHSLTDRVETTLINAKRGTGIAGLRSIEKLSSHNSFTFYRPLLGLTKSQITGLCKLYKIPYIIDPTNFEDFTERNRIRKKYKTTVLNIQKRISFYNTIEKLIYHRSQKVNLQGILTPKELPFSKLHRCSISTKVDIQIVLSILGISGLSKESLQKLYNIFTGQKNSYVHLQGWNFFKAFGRQYIFFGDDKCWEQEFNKSKINNTVKYKQFFSLPKDQKITFFEEGMRPQGSSTKVKKLFGSCEVPIFYRNHLPLPVGVSKSTLKSYFRSGVSNWW